MSQKLPVDGFEWVENTSQFNQDVIKSYNEKSDAGYFLEVDVQYPEKLHDLHNDLDFYLKECRLKKSKNLLLIYMINWICYSQKNLKQALHNGLILRKVYRVIRFNQKIWLKPKWILSWEKKKDFEKDFSSS